MHSHPVSSHDLNAYVDGALSPDERVRVEAQLARDPALRQELAELRATARLLGHLPELRPRRSFTLGADYVRKTAAPGTVTTAGKVLTFLPIVRSLSVAAVLAFMVVGGSLFFEINGGPGNDAQTTFQRQSEILGSDGVTESEGDASDHAEDAPEPAAPAAADESSQEDESSMTPRGDAASAGDDPMDDLTALQESAVQEAGEEEPEASSESADQVAQAADSDSTGTGVPSSDNDRTPWIWTSAAIGGLALALAGLWFALAQVGRQSHASKP